MDKVALPEPQIAAGSTILVTGVNGLIASHVADQLLAAGFKVRGTVRGIAEKQWLVDLFSARHGADRLELVDAPDLAAPGICEKIVRGAAGVVSVAGFARPSTIEEVADSARDELLVFENLLQAAAAEPGIKSFVFTSSAWAAWTPQANTPTTLTTESWNESCVQLAEDAKLPTEVRGFFKYMAVKMKVEKGAWAWIEREKPHFTFNTILPDTVLGPLLDPRNQGGSTAGFVRWLWDGENVQMLKSVPPQWYIDARDLGRLYLATLVSGVNGQRLFGFAGRYSWPKILEIMKDKHPERKDFVDLPDAGWDQTEVPNESSLALLRSTGRDTWISLERAVEDGIQSFIGKGKPLVKTMV